MIKMTLYRIIIMDIMIRMSSSSIIFSIRFIKFVELNNQVGMCKELLGQIAFSLWPAVIIVPSLLKTRFHFELLILQQMGCIFPLWRKVKRILKGLKKQRKKLKRDAERLELTMQNEERLSDEKEQENKGNGNRT